MSVNNDSCLVTGNSVNESPLVVDLDEIQKLQPILNIGTIGHVSNGKSTIVKQTSGKRPQQFAEEQIRNITIQLGYANVKIYKCEKCENHECVPSETKLKNCDKCKIGMKLIRHFSWVDCFDPQTEVMMYDRSTEVVDNLKIGDKLMGPDGTPRTIKSLCEGNKKMYNIKYQSFKMIGSKNLICTGGHLLVLRTDTPVLSPMINSNNEYVITKYTVTDNCIRTVNIKFKTLLEAKTYYDECDKTPIISELTVEAFMNAPIVFRRCTRLFYNNPMKQLKKNSDIYNLSFKNATAEDVAWIVGFYLGNSLCRNGDSSCGSLCGDDGESYFVVDINDIAISERIKSITHKMGFLVGETPNIHFELAGGRTAKCLLVPNRLIEILKFLNVYNRKNIDNTLIYQSMPVRRALIAGYIDSNSGHLLKGYQFVIRSQESNVINNLQWIISSLGFVVEQRHFDEITKETQLIFYGNASSLLPICLPEKKGVDAEYSSYFPVTSQPFQIEELGIGKYKGFETDLDGRFLLSNFIVAHNCPGHQSYMSTMVNGAAVMDAALIVIAADEHIPQPQTAEHLVAVELMELKHGVVALNKLDLITKDQAKEAYKTTLAFLKDTSFENSAVIPVCANYGFNINLIAKAICETIPVPVKNYNLSPRMIVIRSFDVSKSGESAVSVKGGVAGGSIMQGIMRVGQKIEIRPGLIYQRPNAETGETEFLYKPLQTTIVSLLSEKTSLQMAIPGGLIGVGTKLDPALTKQNRLVGQVIGLDLPDVYDELKLKYKLIMTFQCDKPFAKGEQLLLNVQSCEISGSIIMVSSKSKYIIVKLSKPVCVDLNDKVSISKNVNQDWRLAGYGKIERGKPVIRLE